MNFQFYKHDLAGASSKARPDFMVFRVRWISHLLVALLIAACGATPAQRTTQEDARSRLAKAEAMFQERCKIAGERIYRSIEDVEGILLLKIRPDNINWGNQFAMDDPYGRDLGGMGYIETFVRGSFQANNPGLPAPGSPSRLGYLYVDVVDATDGQRYRYTGRMEEPWEHDKSFLQGYKRFVLDKTPALGTAPRYGVNYEDISTHEERNYWIAGSSLQVIDLKTSEVIAERIGYMMDRSQGDRTGNRSPWLNAADNACPSFQRNPLLRLPPGQGAAAQRRQTQDFIEKVLKPKL
jgi:hypothetical protein